VRTACSYCARAVAFVIASPCTAVGVAYTPIVADDRPDKSHGASCRIGYRGVRYVTGEGRTGWKFACRSAPDRRRGPGGRAFCPPPFPLPPRRKNKRFLTRPVNETKRRRVRGGVTQNERDFLNNSRTVSDTDTTFIKISFGHVYLNTMSVQLFSGVFVLIFTYIFVSVCSIILPSSC